MAEPQKVPPGSSAAAQAPASAATASSISESKTATASLPSRPTDQGKQAQPPSSRASTSTLATLPLPPPPGIYVPVPTFFISAPTRTNPSPALDLKTQLHHGLHLARSGISGLVLAGSTGEAISLSPQERVELISYMRGGLDAAGLKGYPLIAGTTEQSVLGVLGQLAAARKAGAQWGMVLAPGFFAAGGGMTGLGIRSWFEAVADLAPMPILIYHYPGVSNNLSIDPLIIAELAKHPNIVGCKLSHGNLSHLTQIAADMDTDHAHFATFTGLGSQLLPVLSVGGAGAIDGLAGIFPKLVVRLWRLYQESCAKAGSGGAGDASAAAKDGEQNDDEKLTPEEIRQEMRSLQYTIAVGYGLIEKYGILGIKAGIRVVLGLGSEMNLRWPLIGSEEPAEDFEDGLAMMKMFEDGC